MKALKFLVPAAAVACLLSPALAQTNSDAKKPGAAQPTPPLPGPAWPHPNSPAKNPGPAHPTPPAKPEAPKAAPKTDPKTEAPKPAVDKVAWVELKTSMGNIVVELDGEKAPISTANFLT